MSECEYVRLEVNVHPTVAEAIRRMAGGHDVSATEVIREAVSLLWLCDNASLAGHRLLLDKGKEEGLAEVVPLWGPGPTPG